VNKKIVVSDLQQQNRKGRFRKVGKEVIRIRMLNEGKRVRQEAARMYTKDKAIAAIRISSVYFPVCLLPKIVAPTFSKPHVAFQTLWVRLHMLQVKNRKPLACKWLSGHLQNCSRIIFSKAYARAVNV
jgi:hypothetical protein